jgi:hypothetical protein
MAPRPKPTEAAVAALVVAWFESAGHDVYQEVACVGGYADIVTVPPNRELWCVETKTGWSLDLLEQCMARRRSFHRVFAAVPSARSGRADHSALFRELGIGVIIVHPDRDWSPIDANEYLLPPRMSPDPRYAKQLRYSLDEGHKTHAKAGTNGGDRWTPWRRTCEELKRVVTARPGATLKEVIDEVKHHYSSPAAARSSLAKWLRAGIIPGVTSRLEDGRSRLYPVGAST